MTEIHRVFRNNFLDNIMKKIFFLIVGLSIMGCSDNPLPKPQGYLRLEYPIAQYETFEGDFPFTFGKNIHAVVKPKNQKGFTINYPNMKGSIYINYHRIENDLQDLLKDAQQFTYRHTKKAETIIEQPYINPQDKVYGMFYDVGGDAASATQFYLTDSLNNFVLGSVYFNVKPNFDSILPASEYIKNDVRILIESIKWSTKQ